MTKDDLELQIFLLPLYKGWDMHEPKIYISAGLQVLGFMHGKQARYQASYIPSPRMIM